MNQEHEAEKIVRELAGNATLIKTKIAEGNLQEATKLTGQRVALVEALRELRDAKVSLANSEILGEMEMLMRNAENEMSEATGNIRARLSALSKDLANVKGARKIAAYAAMRHPAHPVSAINGRDKKKGGRRGY